MREIIHIKVNGSERQVDITGKDYRIGWGNGEPHDDEFQVRNFPCARTWKRYGGMFLPKRIPVISRHHAELRLSNGQRFLCDMASREGTFLNGRRLEQNGNYQGEPLCDGDFIGLAKLLSLPGFPRYQVEVVYTCLEVDDEMES